MRSEADLIPTGSRLNRWRILAWLIIAGVVTNAALFTAQAANPVVVSDAWYYVDVFVSKALDGTLGFADLFVKRGPQDHSLPLHKLVLLANVHWFDLDFTLDSAVGWIFALGSLFLIHRVIRTNGAVDQGSAVGWLGLAAICAVYLSLNASTIFEWPLVTMGFSVQFFFLLLFVASWHAVTNGKYVAVAVFAAMALIVGDGGGVIAVIAAGLGVTLLAMRGASRTTSLAVLGVLLAVGLVYKIAMRMFLPEPPGGVPPIDLATALGGVFSFSNILYWAKAVLADSVIHGVNLQQMAGPDTGTYQTVIASAVAAGHGWFWWQAMRRPPTIIRHFASCMMLLFYGLLAGIVIARVPQFGNEYLHQPRYVIFYQLNLIALLLMGIARAKEVSWSGRGANGPVAGLVLVSILLLLVQIPVSKNSWKREPFQSRYVEGLAMQMGSLARDPDHPPQACSPLLTICRQPVAKRRELMGMLSTHQLNVFSQEFRERHDLRTQ